eukprot:scaffold86528_cov57-Phaeocystis_antarctica.AAC.1
MLGITAQARTSALNPRPILSCLRCPCRRAASGLMRRWERCRRTSSGARCAWSSRPEAGAARRGLERRRSRR